MFIYRPYLFNLLVLMSTVTDLSLINQKNESSCVFGQRHFDGLLLKVMYWDFKLYYICVIKY